VGVGGKEGGVSGMESSKVFPVGDGVGNVVGAVATMPRVFV